MEENGWKYIEHEPGDFVCLCVEKARRALCWLLHWYANSFYRDGIDEILQPAAVPYLHTLWLNSVHQQDNARPTEWGLSETTLSLGVERTDDCSPDLNLTNTCWIRVGMRFGLEWPVQPHWLTCGKWGKKNGIPSHSSVWPRWWQGGGRQLCLCMVLPHAVEASLCSMNKLLNWQYPLVTLDFQQRKQRQQRNKNQTQISLVFVLSLFT